MDSEGQQEESATMNMQASSLETNVMNTAGTSVAAAPHRNVPNRSPQKTEGSSPEEQECEYKRRECMYKRRDLPETQDCHECEPCLEYTIHLIEEKEKLEAHNKKLEEDVQILESIYEGCVQIKRHLGGNDSESQACVDKNVLDSSDTSVGCTSTANQSNKSPF